MGGSYTPQDQVHPPWDEVHPKDQVHPHGPGTPQTRYTPPSWDQVHPPRTRYTPLEPGTPPGPGKPPRTRYTPRTRYIPPGSSACWWDMDNKWAVHILLECILVYNFILTLSSFDLEQVHGQQVTTHQAGNHHPWCWFPFF